MKIRTIDHVSLYVHDVEAVKLYYEEVFGFSCIVLAHKGKRVLQLETNTTHWFINEDTTIALDFIRQQHISFQVDSLEAVIDLLNSRGEPYKIGTYEGFKTRNFRWCAWHDPAGIRVECVEHL